MIFKSTSLTISNTKPNTHKHANLILNKAQSISKKLGITSNSQYKHHTTMTNYLYIGAPIDKMVNAVVTYDTLYFLDDFFGEDTNQGFPIDFQKILDLWSGNLEHTFINNSKTNNLYNSISYIGKSIKRDSPIYFFEKYTHSIVEHLNYSLKSIPFSTVEEYINIRLYTGGMYPVIDLIEYVHSAYITSNMLEKVPSLKKLRELCALIGALSNDLFSYAKEKHSNYNLINAYLITNEASSYTDAVEKSINKVNMLHTDFQETLVHTIQSSNSLIETEKSIVEKYLNALEVLISSCYHWQKSSQRYKHPDNVFEDMRA